MVRTTNLTIWEQEDSRLFALETSLLIPDNKLNNVCCTVIANKQELNSIPVQGGCYWIWTNEPIHHTLHRQVIPNPFDGGEVVYNGIAKDDIRWRVEAHLFALPDAGWSAMSVDILQIPEKDMIRKNPSHRKKAMASYKGAKVPIVNGKRVISKQDLLQLNLSGEEKTYVLKTQDDKFFFRNGINIEDPKHLSYEFKVYYITGLKSSVYVYHIEKSWRERHGVPRLCSYISGR